GAGYRDEHLGSTSIGLEASALFSYRGYEGYELVIGRIERRRDRVGLGPADARAPWMLQEATGATPGGVNAYLDVHYRDYPEQPFYAASANSGQDRRRNFLLFGTSYDAVVQYQVTRTVGVAARAGVLDFGVGPTRTNERANLESMIDSEGTLDVGAQRFLTLGLAAVADTREPRADAHAGFFLGAALWRFDAPSSARDALTRVLVAARSYVTPLTARGVLASRALFSVDATATGASVPFYLQQALGGPETLRGFALDRFRDHALAYLSAEYRWQANRFVDVGPFVDVGVVGPSASAWSAENTRATFGLRAGFRYRAHALFHLDWGRSREGQRVTVGSGVLF
ncbi:MAG: BamA/TamA family outer membrane protein, partial [Bacteroidales bacterium]